MKVENVTVPVRGLEKPVRIALAADLHNRSCEAALQALREDPPEMIAAVGDMMENTRRGEDTLAANQNTLRFFREAARLAPVFYSLGNHERNMEKTARRAAELTGVTLLENAAATWNGLWVGGLSSAGYGRRYAGVAVPDLSFLKEFAALPGPKLLLCHHPEYYPHFVRAAGVDVVFSGHAHGGQWRFFGQGVFAPGQGLFPKYTSGVHEGRLVVSRGLANTAKVPRFGNPTALVYVTLQPEE